jgi:hypothetical protein
MNQAPLDAYERRYLRLLKMGQFQRRRGGWRFGTNKINEAVVLRLLDFGRVVRIGDTIMLPPRRNAA